MSETVYGACLCGGITFEVEEPGEMGFCHCTRCQRWSGGPGMVEVEVEAANFRITKGAELVRRFGETGFSSVCFCAICGSSLYAESGEKYYVSAGTLQDVELDLAYHMMVAYKASWDRIGDAAPQFPERPPGP